MDIKDILRKVIFETYTTDELKAGEKIIKIGDIDDRYKDFAIKQVFKYYGDIFYFHVSLFLIEYNGQLVPLVTMSNILYDPQEVIDEIAKSIQRIVN